METDHHYDRSNGYRNDAERLLFVIRASGLNKSQFARYLGLTDVEELFRILFHKAPLTPAIVGRIYARYPQIDFWWLLSGVVGHTPTSGHTVTFPPHPIY